MNRVQQYLEEYKVASKLNDDDNWKNFFQTYKDLGSVTQNYFKQCFNFLPKNQILDFHDAYVIGNVKPNMNSDTFNLTIRMFCYELNNDKNDSNSYQETDPVYVDFTIDNKFRSSFHKLSVKSSNLMAVVYEDNNLGIAYLDKDWNLKTLYLENIDLKNTKKSNTKENSKKLRM